MKYTTIILSGLLFISLSGCDLGLWPPVNVDFEVVKEGKGKYKLVPNYDYDDISWSVYVDSAFSGTDNDYLAYDGEIYFYPPRKGRYLVQMGTNGKFEKKIISFREDLPNEIVIKSVEILSFPSVNSYGEVWDTDNTGPDIYIETTKYFTKTYWNVANSDLPLTIKLDSTSSSNIFTSNSTSLNFEFFIFDEDPSRVEKMAEIEYPVVQNLNNYNRFLDSASLPKYRKSFTHEFGEWKFRFNASYH